MSEQESGQRSGESERHVNSFSFAELQCSRHPAWSATAVRVHAPLNEHPVKPGCMWCGRRRLLNPDSKGRKARLISEFYEPIKKEKRKKEKKPFQLSLSHKLSVSPHSILCSNVSKRQVKLSVSSLLYPAHESLVILSDYLLISNEFTASNTTTNNNPFDIDDFLNNEN